MSDKAVRLMEGRGSSLLQIDVGDRWTYEDLLSALNINPETVLILSDGCPVPFDDIVEGGEISIIRVVSRG